MNSVSLKCYLFFFYRKQRETLSLRLCACMHVCVRACVCVRVCRCVCASACVCVAGFGKELTPVNLPYLCFVSKSFHSTRFTSSAGVISMKSTHWFTASTGRKTSCHFDGWANKMHTYTRRHTRTHTHTHIHIHIYTHSKMCLSQFIFVTTFTFRNTHNKLTRITHHDSKCYLFFVAFIENRLHVCLCF